MDSTRSLFLALSLSLVFVAHPPFVPKAEAQSLGVEVGAGAALQSFSQVPDFGMLTFGGAIRGYFPSGHGLVLNGQFNQSPNTGLFDASATLSTVDLRYAYLLQSPRPLPIHGSLSIELGAGYTFGKSSYETPGTCPGGAASTCHVDRNTQGLSLVAALRPTLHLSVFTVGLEGGVRVGLPFMNEFIAENPAAKDPGFSVIVQPYAQLNVGFMFGL